MITQLEVSRRRGLIDVRNISADHNLPNVFSYLVDLPIVYTIPQVGAQKTT